jgi:Family of unknown function (DUF6311)
MSPRRFDLLFRPRPWPLPLLLAFAIGAAHALAMLPVGLILGNSDFWAFPRGIVPGGQVDMAGELAGYRYLVQAPWMLPLLHLPNVLPPAGVDAFWLDVVPWLGLVARPLAAWAGGVVNLLGVFLFLALALPGVAMAALLRAAGARGLLAAVAAALLVDPMPSLLIEWGHIALCAQAIVIAALALYVAERRHAGWHNDWHDGQSHSWAWFLLLAFALLTHLYLFMMAGGFWAAATLEEFSEGRRPRARLLLRAVLTIAAIVALALATGILSPQTRSGGSDGFGIGSMNLASPFVPQLSGAIPALREFWVGMRVQVMDYPGLGVLLLVAAGALVRLAGGGPRPGPWTRHWALLAFLLGCVLFALSNRVTLGARVLLEVPLPAKLAYALGAFRASGRFFWPVLYTLISVALLALLRARWRVVSVVVLAAACVVQVIDAGPLRAAIAASAAAPVPPLFDRARAAELLAPASALLVFPTIGCLYPEPVKLPDPMRERRLAQANVELQLLASKRNLPLNTMANPRLAADCVGEAATRQAKLLPGVAYFYLEGAAPAAEQLGGRDPAAVCEKLDWVLECRLPE